MKRDEITMRRPLFDFKWVLSKLNLEFRNFGSRAIGYRCCNICDEQLSPAKEIFAEENSIPFFTGCVASAVTFRQFRSIPCDIPRNAKVLPLIKSYHEMITLYAALVEKIAELERAVAGGEILRKPLHIRELF